MATQEKPLSRLEITRKAAAARHSASTYIRSLRRLPLTDDEKRQLAELLMPWLVEHRDAA